MRSFFEKIKETLKIIVICAKELKWLWHIFDVNKSDRPVLYAEIVDFNPIRVKDFLLIKGELSKTEREIINEEREEHPSCDGRYWYHINGMIAHPSELEVNGAYLEKLFGCHINHIYNPTDGFIPDLYQVYSGRVLNRFEEESRKAKEVIARKLLEGKKCVLIAHSQGGIIASNVMRLLAKDGAVSPLCVNLEVYTFGSAMDEFTNPNPKMHAEHFINEYDFVARVGPLSYKDKIQGKMYVRLDARGHLLNRNYMGAFEKGLYCHERSRLYSYIKRII